MEGELGETSRIKDDQDEDQMPMQDETRSANYRGLNTRFGRSPLDDVLMIHPTANPISAFDHFYAFGAVDDISSQQWILDSGVSIQICCNADLMKSLRRLDVEQNIFLPDGSKQQIEYSGAVQLTSDLELTKVLFAPAFTHNLVSVSQLAKDMNAKCTFMDTHCLIQKKTGDSIMGIARAVGKLYAIDVDHRISANFVTQVTGMTGLQWHRLLGHASFTSMQHMNDIKVLCTAEVKAQIDACEICHKEKQCRNPFPLTQRRKATLCELIHIDVWGPYHGDSITNTPYMLTIVEDHSRSTWTFLMTTKDRDLLASKGIIHQRACAYSPQQNGIVERRHRSLLQIARALMFQSKVPAKLWPYSILCATWLLNRTPNPITEVILPDNVDSIPQADYDDDTDVQEFIPDQSSTSTAPFMQHSPSSEPANVADIGVSVPVADDSCVALNKGKRIIKPPYWKKDFVACSTSQAAYEEPSSFSEASKFKEWVEAMDCELTTLEKNGTWYITNLPQGKNAISSKWVYKVKLNAYLFTKPLSSPPFATLLSKMGLVDFHRLHLEGGVEVTS